MNIVCFSLLSWVMWIDFWKNKYTFFLSNGNFFFKKKRDSPLAEAGRRFTFSTLGCRFRQRRHHDTDSFWLFECLNVWLFESWKLLPHFSLSVDKLKRLLDCLIAWLLEWFDRASHSSINTFKHSRIHINVSTYQQKHNHAIRQSSNKQLLTQSNQNNQTMMMRRHLFARYSLVFHSFSVSERENDGKHIGKRQDKERRNIEPRRRTE